MTLRFHRRLTQFDVISFDLDDTLYDNVPIMQNAERCVHAFIEQNYPQTIPWDIDHWRERRMALMRSDSRLASDMTALRLATLRQGFTEAGIEAPEAAANHVMQQFHFYRSDFKVAPETLNILSELRQRFTLCAISNGNVDCKRIGLSGYFDIVVQPNERLRGKPHSDMFNTAVNHLQITPSRLLHIGDHPWSDVVGAHRAGCQSGWYRDGLGSEAELHIVPTFSFNHIEQLLEL